MSRWRNTASERVLEGSLAAPSPLRTMSVQQVTWLFFRKPDELKQEERENLRMLRQASSKIETAYHLVGEFLQMVRERTGDHLDSWLEAVKASHLQAFDSFVTGVQQDHDAVLAGLTLAWSNGALEGHVNRLKLIKRSMYGQAKFDLLKRRVFCSPQKSLSAQMQTGHQPRRDRPTKGKADEKSQIPQHTIFGISRAA